MLVFVDAVTGKMITNEGRKCVMGDPEGLQFPWIPEPLSDLLNNGVLLRQKETVSSQNALKGKIKGLFFSAHWVLMFNIL